MPMIFSSPLTLTLVTYVFVVTSSDWLHVLMHRTSFSLLFSKVSKFLVLGVGDRVRLPYH